MYICKRAITKIKRTRYRILKQPKKKQIKLLLCIPRIKASTQKNDLHDVNNLQLTRLIWEVLNAENLQTIRTITNRIPI